MTRPLPLLWIAACAPTDPPPGGPAPEPLGWAQIPVAPPAVPIEVTWSEDGFSPARIEAHPGDVIRWHLPDDRAAVVPVDPDAPDPCAAVAAADDPGPVGPAVRAAGVWTADPEAAGDGVSVTLSWAEVEPVPGSYRWAALDAVVEAALAEGRPFGVAISSSAADLPPWLDDAAVVTFPEACGDVTVADPLDPGFQSRWDGVLAALADHLRARADAWRSLAWVGLGGAGVDGLDQELPRGGCADEVWARRGYRSALLVSFYEDQLARVAARFPGKSAVFHVVRDGFPAEAGGPDPVGAILAAGARSEGFVPRDRHLCAGAGPEPLVVAAGDRGAFVVDGDDPGAALRRAWADTASAWVEVPGDAPPRWSGRFTRRDPAPSSFAWVVPDQEGTVGFADPSRCAVGTVVIRPR